MIKVLHVNLAKGFRGGERQTEILIRALSKQADIQQQIACRVDSPLRDRLSDIVDLIFIDANHQLDGHLTASNTADIIHAHEAKAVHWAWVHNALYATPYLLTRRVDAPIKDSWFNQLIYRKASARVAISRIIKNIIETKDWGEATIIPSVTGKLTFNETNSINIKSQYPNKIIVGHIGALVDKHKGQKTLIETARLLQTSHQEIQFLVLGDGSDRQELEALSNDLNNIRWLGFKDNISDYIHAFDYFMFPSRNEGLGSTLLDVIDAKVPIIASNVGGIPDIIIHEQTGLLVEPDDAHGFAQSLIRLIEDVTLKASLVENATLHLVLFTPEKMAQSYETQYNLIIKQP